MRNKQGITIAALIIAIIGLSIGFAAFSNTLTISQGASVDPSASNLKVVFAKNYYTEQVTTLDTTAVVPTKNQAATTANIGVTNGVINNNGQNGPTLTGLSAAFTAPGQSVTYDLYVVNDGKLKAYLTDLVFGTTGSPAKKVSCTVATKDSNNQDISLENQATDSLVQAACEGISISVKVGSLEAMTSSGSLNNLELNAKGYAAVQIVISYASGSAYVDGPMNVAFGDITINASSVGTQIAQGEAGEGSNDSCFSIAIDSNDSTKASITDYDETCGTNVIIPSQISKTMYRAKYNSSKCFAIASSMEGDAATTCAEFQQSLESLPLVNDILEIATMMGASSVEEVESAMDFETVNMTLTINKIDEFAFSLKLLTNVTIPNTVTIIDRSAFAGNRLTSIIIPDSVTTIENDAFQENNLTSLQIGTSNSAITYLGARAFGNDYIEADHADNPLGIALGPNQITSVIIYASESDVTDGGQSISGYVGGTVCWVKDNPSCVQ